MDNRLEKIAELALQKGIIKDPQWLQRLEEPVPLWVVLELTLQMIEKLEKPSSFSYD
jgi:hypothetical protein